MDTVALNWVLDAIGRLPGWLIYGYYWTKVLDVRGVKTHWTVWMAIWAVTSLRAPVMAQGTIESVVWTVGYLVLYPILMSRGRLWYRVIVAITTMITCLIGEMLASAVYGMFGDIFYFRDVLDHPVEYALTQLLLVLIYAVFFYLLYGLFARIAHQRTNPTLGYFGIGLLAQLALTSVMLAVTEWFLWGDTVILIATCLFAVVNIVADALILLSVARANEAYEQRMRAEALRVQLDASLAHFKGLADKVQAVARFRHDLRDELQAVAALVRRGDYARAEALVGELEERLGGGRATEGGAR